MERKIKNFKELRIWKLGKEICIDIYNATKNFPRTERFGLSDQMRRAAVSIPSNIAEGFNRFHQKEYQQFLFTALGSCAELETQIIISNEMEFLDSQKGIMLIEKIQHVSRAIRKLISIIQLAAKH